MGSFSRKARRRSAIAGSANLPEPPVPAALAESVERLRRLTIDARDLQEPWVFFHDELAVSPVFVGAGAQRKHPTLGQVIQRAAGFALPDVRLGTPRFIQLGDLWHGMVETSVFPGVFYYFGSEDIGVLGLLGEGGASQSHLVRFSVAVAAGGAVGVAGAADVGGRAS